MSHFSDFVYECQLFISIQFEHFEAKNINYCKKYFKLLTYFRYSVTRSLVNFTFFNSHLTIYLFIYEV